MPRFIDKTGQTYGDLYVIERAPNRNRHVYWKCRCSCGKELEVRGDYLNMPNPGCGHSRVEAMRKAICKIKPGDKYGRLTVIQETEKRAGNGCIIWECLCDCGTTTYVTSDALNRKNNPTKSCGCLQREDARDALTEIVRSKSMKPNTIENGFEILETKMVENEKGEKHTWAYAKCPFCNNIKWIPAIYIRTQDVKSCGCISRSAGETKIKKLLDDAKIPYETEKTFDDLVSKNSYKLRFDFWVDNKYVIEFDGEQHYKPVSFGVSDLDIAQENLARNQLRDKLKDDWCKSHNIPIIRIPYTKYQILTLEDLLLETTQFRVV